MSVNDLEANAGLINDDTDDGHQNDTVEEAKDVKFTQHSFSADKRLVFSSNRLDAEGDEPLL